MAALKTLQQNAKRRKAEKDSLSILKGIGEKAKAKKVTGPPDPYETLLRQLQPTR